MAVLLLNNKGILFTFVGFFVRRPGGQGSKYILVFLSWVAISSSNLKCCSQGFIPKTNKLKFRLKNCFRTLRGLWGMISRLARVQQVWFFEGHKQPTIF